jgi:hypothetical protein
VNSISKAANGRSHAANMSGVQQPDALQRQEVSDLENLHALTKSRLVQGVGHCKAEADSLVNK